MVARAGEKVVEQMDKRVHQGTALETDKYKCLRRVINTEENLKGYIQDMRQKFIILLVEINAIRWKNQVGTENSRMKLKLYEACLMSAILQWRSSMGLDTGKKIDERMQWNAKQSIQIVTTSLKVNINVRSADEVKDVSNLEVFTAQYNDAISQYNQAIYGEQDHTTEHVLQQGRHENRKQRYIKENTEREWEEVAQIIRANKKNRRKKREYFGRKKDFSSKEE